MPRPSDNKANAVAFKNNAAASVSNLHSLITTAVDAQEWEVAAALMEAYAMASAVRDAAEAVERFYKSARRRPGESAGQAMQLVDMLLEASDKTVTGKPKSDRRMYEALLKVKQQLESGISALPGE